MRPPQSSWKWLLAVLLALIAVGLGSLLLRHARTASDLRERVVASLSEWTGGTVALAEPLVIRYFPPSIEGGITVSGATKLPSVQSIAAPSFRLTLSLPGLLLGNIKFNALRLDKPALTLKSDTGTESADAIFGRLTEFLADAPLQTVRIRGGKIGPPHGAPLLSAVDVRLNALGQFSAMETYGSFNFNGEPVTFSFDRGKFVEAGEKRSATVAIKVTSAPLTARFSGTIHMADTLEGEGNLEAKLPDIRRFLGWTGVVLPEGDSLKDASASGRVHWAGTTLTFDDGTFDFDGNEAVGLLAVTAGPRPRLDGTLAFEQLTLDPYLPDLESEAARTRLFDWVLLKHLDADLRLSAAKLSARGLQLGQGGFTINAKNGKISNEIGALEFCGGEAEGRLDLDLSASRSEASLSGTLANVTLTNCLQSFGLDVPVKGSGTLNADISTGGTTHEELIRGLAGTIKVSAADGSLPVDLAALLAQPDAEASGWSQNAGTDYSALDADCSLSAGHLWCQSFHLVTDKGALTGAGGLDIAQQTLDWNFRMADPVAPADPPEGVSKSQPRITMNGTLSVPLIARTAHPAPRAGVSTQETQVNRAPSVDSP